MVLKKLISDIANVRKLPTITICTDVIKCYDKVFHLFTSLYAQYFRAETVYLAVLFRTITECQKPTNQVVKVYHSKEWYKAVVQP